MPQNSIRSLVYISTARAGMDDGEVQAIVDASLRNNEKNGITGLLVFNGNNFIQLLEGAAENVNNCAAVIAGDPRHDGMIVIDRREKVQREFPDWHMASKTVSNGPTTSYSGLSEMLEDKLVSEDTRKLFRNFCSLGVSGLRS